MPKVLIVEDHPLVVEGLRKLLLESGFAEIYGIAYNGADCMAYLNVYTPDIVLLDINLPDISGIDLCKQIKEKYPDVKILGISSFKEKSYIRKMIENGASGYALKNATPHEIIFAIKEVLNGNTFLSEDVYDILEQKENNELALILTKREKEVLSLIADGLTNQEIAEKLFISPLTVDSHRKNLLMKLNAKNTAALIKIAVTNKLIDLDEF